MAVQLWWMSPRKACAPPARSSPQTKSDSDVWELSSCASTIQHVPSCESFQRMLAEAAEDNSTTNKENICEHSNLGDVGGAGFWKRVWPSLWPCLLYAACSCVLHISNKLMFTLLDFHFVFIFAALQSVTASGIIVALWCGGLIDVVRPSAELLLRLLPLACLNVLNIVCGMCVCVCCPFWSRYKNV